MNQQTFISRVRSILNDNAAPRQASRQRSGSGLDEARLGLVSGGEVRVFKKAVRRLSSRYEIALLIDLSGSMSGQKLVAACESMHAIWYALTCAGANVSCFGFNRVFHEFNASTVSSMRGFYKTCKDLMNNREDANGNHDGYAVTCAASYLLSRPDSSRMLFVFSDGRPVCEYQTCTHDGCYKPESSGGKGSHEWFSDNLIHSVKQARAQGVTCLAIGLLTDSPQEFYGRRFSVCVNEPEKLYDSALGLLSRNIRRG